MRKNFYASFLAFVIAFTVVGSSAAGQARRSSAPALIYTRAAAPAQVVPLPASDAVMFVDVRRLLTEAIPRALAGNPAKLAEVTAEIDKFRARTGIDARSFDRVAIGVRLTSPSPNRTKLEPVAVAHGTFNPGAFVAAGRLASKGRYQEQQYSGKTIYVFTLNEQVKLFGLFNMRLSDVAVAALDANTLAIGKPESVRAAIDTSAGRGRVSPEMVTLATRNPNAIIGFGGNLPASMTRGLDLGNEEIAKSIASIRQFYGSVGSTANGFDMLTVLRTGSATDARNLSDTLTAVKQLAPLFVSRLSGDKGKLAQNAIDSLKVGAQGNEVQISLELAQTDVTTLVRVF